ncbi:hypothetical protein KAI87_09105 [Myxococcota bacterium]|nr:hypothetical protein [Myxococcota bacterium]
MKVEQENQYKTHPRQQSKQNKLPKSPILFSFVLLASVLGACAPILPSGKKPLTHEQLHFLRDLVKSELPHATEREWERWRGVSGNQVNCPSSQLANTQGLDPWALHSQTLDGLRLLITKEKDPEELRSLQYLHAHLVHEVLRLSLQKPDGVIHKGEQKELDKQGVPPSLHQLGNALAKAPSFEERQELSHNGARVFDALADSIQERFKAAESTAQELGYDSLLDAACAARHHDLRAGRPLAERILRESDLLWLTLMGEISKEYIQEKGAKIQARDLPRLVHQASNGVPDISSSRALDISRRVVLDLGISFASLNLTIDSENRSSKNTTPAASTVTIPDDIRLSIPETTDLAGLEALMHEVGHALHFAHSREERIEFQALGSAASAEAFAFMFNLLAANPKFWEHYLNFDAKIARHAARNAAFRSLLILRRASAMLLVALDWRNHSIDDGVETIQKHFGRALMMPISVEESKRILYDFDPLLYVDEHLRGFLLAGILVEKLGSMPSDELGWKLKDLWKSGQKHLPEEVAAHMGYPQLTATPTLSILARALLSETAALKQTKDP